MRLLFVVHRYYPFPGGSEYFVQDMAEEARSRGHNVAVLAHTHQGPQNGVFVTEDYNVLGEPWDLIIVHGGDVISQDIVHLNAEKIPSPVAYMLIKPSESSACLKGLKEHPIITYSTEDDLKHIFKYGVQEKARRIRHGINLDKTVKDKKALFRNQGKLIYVSVGGFSPHKAMVPLAEAFEKNIDFGELHLYGYMDGPTPPETDKVKIFKDKTKDEVLEAIAGAEAYIMNSHEEGFGLVLLEAMANHTPWYARNIAGAAKLKKFGTLYENEDELMKKIRVQQIMSSIPDLTKAAEYVSMNHSIIQTVNDIEDIVYERMTRR